MVFAYNQNDLNKKLTIKALMIAVNDDRAEQIRSKIEQIRNSLRQYGLPKNESKITDYLILQMAIENRKTEIAKLLINAGCRVNENNNDTGYTPLALAIQTENEELATLLLEKGANWDAGKSSGLSVLHLAAMNRSVKMLRFLTQHRISIDHISNGKTPFQMFLENHSNIIYEKQNTDIVELFLAKGASMNFKTGINQTVLHHVVKTKNNGIIKKVLQDTDNVNDQNGSKNTALHNLLNEWDFTERNVDVVKLLISRGAKINIQNSMGNTVCHLAAKKKYLQVLQIFLQHQWDVNCRNQEGNTVLHCILTDSADYNNTLYLQVVNHILKQNSLELVRNSEGETPLHIAAINKQNVILNHMLSKHVDINATDDNGNTVLYIFMKNLADKNIVPNRNDIEIIKKMILIGANPATCHYSTKISPMYFALQLRNKEIILLMLECSFDFDTFDQTLVPNQSILYLLCGKTDYIYTKTEELHMAKIAKICIKKGATVDARDGGLKTPLYWAVLLRQKHMVKTLLEYGANPNFLDNEGGTILENLMKKAVPINLCDHQGQITFYRMKKKQIPQNIERDSEIAQMLLLKKAVAEKTSNNQLSIFHYCAVNLHLGMLREIIFYCQDVNIRDSQKNTILHSLLTYNLNTNKVIEKEVAEIVAILLSKGAEVAALNENGETPLHLAAKCKHLETSKMLLQENANVANLDNNGNSVLHFLCMLQSMNVLVEKGLTELFVSEGCDVNARNKHGMTPLLFAAKSGSVNMIKILLELNATINCAENKNLSTPIHLATELNYEIIIGQLIQGGADVNVRRRDRKTALHLSVAHKLPKVTRLLLEGGADTDLKDSEAKTPLHWACWYESLDNINELLDYGADVNVENDFQVTPIMLAQQSNDTWIKLYYHVVKLKIANMPVSNRNKCHMEKYNKEYAKYSHASKVREFESTAIEEILRMDKVSIDVRTTLTDVLLMSANKLSVFKNNEDFQKLLYSDDFKQKFPIYADLVRACYRKGIIRSDLLILAKYAFRKILGLALPDTCCDAIFCYLDNENLHNLDEAAKIKITKRKRSSDKINKSIPAKRVRRISV